MKVGKMIEWASLSTDEWRVSAGTSDQGRVIAWVSRDGHVPVHHEAIVCIRAYEIEKSLSYTWCHIIRESLNLPSMSLAVEEDDDSLLLLTAVVEGVTGALSGTAGAGESEEKSRR